MKNISNKKHLGKIGADIDDLQRSLTGQMTARRKFFFAHWYILVERQLTDFHFCQWGRKRKQHFHIFSQASTDALLQLLPWH